jgi:hypothetical protein
MKADSSIIHICTWHFDFMSPLEKTRKILKQNILCGVSEFITSFIAFIITQFIPEVSVERLALRLLTPKSHSNLSRPIILVPRSMNFTRLIFSPF